MCKVEPSSALQACDVQSGLWIPRACINATGNNIGCGLALGTTCRNEGRAFHDRWSAAVLSFPGKCRGTMRTWWNAVNKKATFDPDLIIATNASLSQRQRITWHRPPQSAAVPSQWCELSPVLGTKNCNQSPEEEKAPQLHRPEASDVNVTVGLYCQTWKPHFNHPVRLPTSADPIEIPG